MRTLVVHDREVVLEEIAGLLVEVGGPRCVVDRASDMVTARDFLRSRHYDLAIVDLTIPAAAGIDDTALRNADWLLVQAFEGTDLKTPADVIAISRDADAVDGIRNSIGEHVLVVLTEDPNGQWKEQLKDRIRYVRNTRRSRIQAANSAYDIDVVFITALDKERRPYSDLLELSPCAEMEGAWEFVLNSKDGRVRRGVLVSVGVSGQAPAAATTQAVLTQFRPQLIVMTGFCGGVQGKVDLGDIAVMKSATPWDYGKWAEEVVGEGAAVPKFLPRGEPVPISLGQFEANLRALLDEVSPLSDEAIKTAGQLSEGVVSAPVLRCVSSGSGSSVVTSVTTLGRIAETNEAIHAVDMESYAFYRTCRHTPVISPDYACIKGVADFCNGEKDDRLHAACSYLSAWLAVDIVCRRYDFASGFYPQASA